jgi:hypothetical protein
MGKGKGTPAVRGESSWKVGRFAGLKVGILRCGGLRQGGFQNGNLWHTPGSFVRVASKGVTGYVTWKSV